MSLVNIRRVRDVDNGGVDPEFTAQRSARQSTMVAVTD
jgi:hypothetical protein